MKISPNRVQSRPTVSQRSVVITVDTMCLCGRALPSALLSRLLYICACVFVAGTNDYGIPIEIKLWDSGRTPLAHMVDVTNGFGLKVLAEHNFLNDNNIAFSPYGLMGILVALYEGVDGESSYQIKLGMQLPWNRNVMRIGFRDIHRTLKTYFVPEEGFLAGLALNNENVTFNENYKKVLRFYGFDLENEKLPTFAPQGNNSTNDTTNENPTTTPAPSVASPSTTATTQTGMTGREETSTLASNDVTTANPSTSTEIINEIDIRGPTTTTASPVSNTESAPMTSTVPSTAEQIITTDQAITETEIPATTTSSTTTSSTLPPTQDTSSVTTTTATATAPQSSPLSTMITQTDTTTVATSNTPAVDEQAVNNEVEVLTTPDVVTNAVAETTAADMVSSIPTTRNAETESTTTVMETQSTEQLISTLSDMSSTLSDSMTTMANSSTLETLERRKKSIVDFIFTSPPYMDDYLYRSYDIGVDSPTPNLDEKLFLANGLRSVQVTYMHYDTILEHAYLPHLEASALRLPLDSERYYLLVVLPSRGGSGELGRLLTRMARESDLRDVYAALRPRRVRAVVPSFTVKGHITLTTDLQKLGIRDVFEPRQRDFSPMTPQSGVYVRSIEQAVSVAIRKYRPDDQKKNRYVNNQQRVYFSATYPFLYYVMDASIHVALMAGKMVDPLNTRIL